MTKKILMLTTLLLCGFIFCTGSFAGQKEQQKKEKTKGGYLFAHMINADYGKLYYSISRDGLKWEKINAEKRINDEYIGHPDICKGGDGRYYMVGVNNLKQQIPVLWVSKDLITWEIEKELPASLFTTQMPGNPTDVYLGAPKLFYDKDSRQYIMTWHASSTGLTEKAWWEGMRTYYVLTSDFVTITEPKKLFDFKGDVYNEMGAIDVIIRKIDGVYYAIIKDERWPNAEKGVQGKAICIAKSANMTGPYSDPDGMVTASWLEAPAIVPNADNSGWYIYVEDYGKHEYRIYECKGFSTQPADWNMLETVVSDTRHGAVIRISEKEYRKLKKVYGK